MLIPQFGAVGDCPGKNQSTYRARIPFVHLTHSVPTQEATSASLAVDERAREELDARRQRAKAEFLLGRDRSDAGQREHETEPVRVRDPCREPKCKPPQRKKSMPPPGRAYNSALAGKVALEREAMSRLPPPRGDCAVVEVSFTPRESRAPKRDTKVRFGVALSKL